MFTHTAFSSEFNPTQMVQGKFQDIRVRHMGIGVTQHKLQRRRFKSKNVNDFLDYTQ